MLSLARNVGQFASKGNIPLFFSFRCLIKFCDPVSLSLSCNNFVVRIIATKQCAIDSSSTGIKTDLRDKLVCSTIRSLSNSVEYIRV